MSKTGNQIVRDADERSLDDAQEVEALRAEIARLKAGGHFTPEQHERIMHNVRTIPAPDEDNAEEVEQLRADVDRLEREKAELVAAMIDIIPMAELECRSLHWGDTDRATERLKADRAKLATAKSLVSGQTS